jgi:hypothetical protein
MSKIKQQLKELWRKILIDIFIYKDPFNPFPEQDNESETDKERR